MTRWILFALLLVQAPAQAAPSPLGTEHVAQARCVAALAIVAGEQQRGAADWSGYPALGIRGAKFSDHVIGTLMKQTGRSREEARAAVLAQLSALQAESAQAGDPVAFLREAADPCIIMLDGLVPSPRKPTLPQCAAALTLAFEDEKAHQGMSASARTLAVFSSVLDGRARAELKAAGKTEAESDIVIGLEREKLLMEFRKHRKKGVQDKIDFQSCFEMARP